MYYKSIIENVSKVFSSYFDAISVTYNFDIGSEFEIALCHVFTHFLPEKYGICRGFIVDGDDNSAGDDLIIYDKSMFRAIRHMEIADFSR
ncbi:hypothetical protein IG604_22310, partial [Vibrio cholerae]|nr:hypothetical protein [Vibrio cholerae]